MRLPSALFVVALAALAGPVQAQGPAAADQRGPACPAWLDGVKRLVVVTVPQMGEVKASVSSYARRKSGGRWVKRSGPVPAVVGRTGLGWGIGFRDLAREGEPVKVEGDKRAPAGIYRLGATFGFNREDRAGYVRLKKDRHYCVDDLRATSYGSILPRSKVSEGVSGEDMRSFPLYRRGIFVEYPADRELKGGSCIFIHVAHEDGRGTVGCVAMAERAVEELQDWVSAGKAAIAILPATARERFTGCLP